MLNILASGTPSCPQTRRGYDPSYSGSTPARTFDVHRQHALGLAHNNSSEGGKGSRGPRQD